MVFKCVVGIIFTAHFVALATLASPPVIIFTILRLPRVMLWSCGCRVPLCCSKLCDFESQEHYEKKWLKRLDKQVTRNHMCGWDDDIKAGEPLPACLC
jgi:hypothetical protein